MGKSNSFRISSIKNIAIAGLTALVSFYALMLIARKFGGNAGSDAYFFLLSLSTFAVGLVNPLFATVFLPMIVSLRIRSGQEVAERFASDIFSWCMVVIVPLGVLSYFAYVPFYSAFSRFGVDRITEARAVLIYFAPVFVISVFSEFFRTLVLATGRYTVAAVSSLIQPVFLVGSIYLFSETLNEEALAISLLASKVLMLVMMAWIVVYKDRLRIAFRLRTDALVGKFYRDGYPYWTANAVTGLATFFFDYAASGLGAGVLASIAYAQRIAILPTALVFNPVLEIARTKFSEAHAKDDHQQFSLYYEKLVRLVAYISIPLAVFIYFFASEIISSLFQRGSFDSRSVGIAAECLRILAFAMPFSCLFMVNGRASESFQRLRVFSFMGGLGNLLMIFLTSGLIASWGYLGIPYARLAIDMLYFFPLGFIFLYFFDKELKLNSFVKDAAIALVASGVPVAAYFYSGVAVRMGSWFPSLPLLMASFLCFVLLYSTLAWLMTRDVFKLSRN